MVDIETLGTKTGSVITQIGAVYFNRSTGELGEEMLVNVSIDDCLKNGLRVDGGAIKFWFEQPHKDFLKAPVGLSKALQLLRDFYKRDTITWSHATFDMTQIAEAYYKLGQNCPIPYRKMRDIRTLVDLANIEYNKPKNVNKTHNALDDCKYQVAYCVPCINALKERKNVR